MKNVSIIVFILLTLQITGCSVNVPIDVYDDQIVDQPTHKNHTKVVIFVPPEVSEESYGQVGVLAVGVLLDWQLAAGDAIADSSKNFFENYFSNVEVRQENYVRGACSDCALAVVPSIDKLAINKVTMQSKVAMNFSIYDGEGAKVLALPISGRSKVLTLERFGVGVVAASVPVVSSFAANHVLSKSVEDAFEDAFWKLHLQMKEHTETGALARNWLPKELRKKENYGRYEFAAERAIIGAGCQFPQDGLRLVQTGFEELYEAYCWKQEPFMVSCNGSQCNLIYSEPHQDDINGFAAE